MSYEWTGRIRNRHLFWADVIFIVLSVVSSYALRLELISAFTFYLPAVLWLTVLALVVKLPVYFFFGLYRRVWVYASTSELRSISLAVTLASLLYSALALFLYYGLGWIQPGMSRSALIIDWMLSLLFVGGSRFALRLLAEERKQTQARPRGRARRVLVVGAGDAGALVVREMRKNPQLNLTPVAFLDDDPAKRRQQIHGVPVVGALDDLGAALDRYAIDEVIIAIPSAPGTVVRRVAEACRDEGIPFRTMPGLYELIGGKVSVSRLREVNIDDLLRRKPALIDDGRIGRSLSGKRVLVTGAGGSIGRELCRQIARWGPAELVLLGHGENAIFEALLELREDYPHLPIFPVIADVRDADRLHAVFRRRQPEVVFHAAAHKHVPLMEVNVEEAVSNNVLGTQTLVQVAEAADVPRLVLISTDKAVHPANVYGATKRLSEMIVLSAARRGGRAYSVVRFGNVLGSRGSVVPLFKRQIAAGGPVKITHPDMERYFMTIPEAVHLVLQAAAMGQGGEAFLLNMGEQVRIVDLAEDLIRLSGLEPGRDIEIVFTGVRPGEKLREELWEADKTYEPTAHPEIFRSAAEDVLPPEELDALLRRLADYVRAARADDIVALLDEAIPGAAIRETPPPDLTTIL